MTRLFVALWPPDAVVTQLCELARPETPDVRWVPPNRWHVTVAFLGDVDEADACAALGGVRHPRVEVALGPAVALLGPDVVVVPAGGVDPLASVVAAAFAEVTESADPRPYVGHLTLARLRRRAECTLVGTPLRAEWTAERAVLVRSARGPDGPAYTVVAEVPLLGPDRSQSS